MDLDLPYARKTPQILGRDAERYLARERGARQHPNSGAGRIKDDASNEDTIYEFKTANKSFTLNAKNLEATFMRASKQGKSGVWVIQFANGITAELHLGINQKGTLQ